eukprot:1159251-Pelagomonas_calceolata.AAC.4
MSGSIPQLCPYHISMPSNTQQRGGTEGHSAQAAHASKSSGPQRNSQHYQTHFVAVDQCASSARQIELRACGNIQHLHNSFHEWQRGNCESLQKWH